MSWRIRDLDPIWKMEKMYDNKAKMPYSFEVSMFIIQAARCFNLQSPSSNVAYNKIINMY